MFKTLLAVMMMLPAVQAGDLDAGLAAMRRRLGTHPVAQRKLSGLHHRAALVSGTLGETAAALERVEGPDASRQLAYLRERLLTASRSIEADFASIEATLAGLGLPEKLEAWRGFVRHYRGRMAEVDAELAALSANGSGLSSSELRRRLAALRAKFGSARAAPVEESVTGPDLIAPIGRESVTYRSADDTPVPGDLAQSSVVLLTAEIRAKAAALDSNPLNLYNWVATHTEYVPYLGQMQNSLAVLQSGRGNAFDQSTLLIALLRASGIPARYVFADVAMSRADVRDWMGVKDESILLGLLSTGLIRMFQLQGDRVIAGHAWVEAYLDSPSGKRWMGMDPARKRRKYQPGILLTQPPYDRMAYLKALKPVPPSEAYFDLLRADLQKRFLGRGFNEVPYIGAPLPPPPPTTDPPYSVVKLYFRASEAPTDYRNKIILTLSDYGGPATYLNTGLNLPDVVLQSITLSYNPASAADRAVIGAFGGLEQVPAAVVNLIPEIRLQGQVIATGKTPLPMGATLDFAITNTAGAMDTRQYVNHNMCTAGETAAVVLGANQVGEELLANRISSFLSQLPVASTAELTRRLLDVAAIRYLHRLGMETQRLSDFLQVRFFQVAGVENAVTFASLEPQNLFDRPFVVTPGRLKIHANPTAAPLLDLNRSDQNGPVLRIAWQLRNDASSVLEHEVWEELVMIPSVSTMKILQTAIRDNVSIRTINRDNAAAEMRDIVAAASTKAAMQQAINAGATLMAPQRPVTIGAWKGQGWIEESADWSFAYRIDDASPAGFAPGGDTGGSPAPPRPPAQEPGTTGQPGPVQNTTCSDPVNVANGNLFEQTTDYTLATQGPDIVFQRTYSSLSLADGPLGPGWRHSYQVSLKDSGGSIVIQDGSGAVLNFRQAGGAYVSPPGYNLKLSKDAQGYLLRTKNGIESRFDLRGVLQSITDRNRNALQFTYEADRLRRTADRAGRGLTLSYDSKGRITSLEDFTGRRVSYEYDTAGHLAAATNAGGNRTVYAYYTDNIYKHLLKSFTTPEGGVTSFQFYGNGKAARVTLAGGQSMSFVYLPLRNETHVIDARGLLTSYQFNALGNVVRVSRPDGSSIDRIYNADAKLEAQTDAAGYMIRYTYDAAGNMTSVTDPLGRAMRFTYDPVFNLLTSIRDAGGNVTQFEYDTRGNLTRSVQPLGVEARFTWDGLGNMISRTDAEGNTVTITYDELGNPTAVRDALGNLTRREFDRLKRVTHGVDALGGETRLEYDALNRIVRQLDQLGRAAAVTYDRDGRLLKTTDPEGRTATFRYDAMNHLAQVTDALGQVTQYTYAAPDCGCSASANLSAFRDAAGFARSQAYDFLDRLVSTTDPLGNSTRYGYDAQGNLARRTDANGNATTLEYDPLGRLTGRAFSDGSGARFAYDANNNLISASNQHVTYTFTYDAMNRLRTFTDSRFNKTLTYDYDRLGRRTSLTDSEGGVFAYSWDANSRMASVQNPAGATAAFTYDALSRRTGLTYSNGAVSDYQYDAAGRLASLVHGNRGAPAPFAGFAYGYDAADNAVTLTDISGTHQYQYDPLDRLVAAAHPSLPAESYRYDGAGNRLASSNDPGYTYDAAGRLVAAEGATYLYDKNGNLIRKTTVSGTTTYTWDIANQLVRIDLPDGGVATYKYDPLGRRIEKSVNGVATAYLYDLSSVLLELDSGGAMQARYTPGPGVDLPLMMERGGQVYFYHQDGQANVAHLTDASGNTVCSYSYDSFGRSQPCQNVANPYGFAGREYDAESGLYYMRARYYDPSLGRFLSPDPLDLTNLLLSAQDQRAGLALLPASSAALVGYAGMAALRSPQQLNPYSYALNNPAAFRDPSGLRCGVYVIMGAEPSQGGASGDPWIRGEINDFQGWLRRNDYSLSYTEGSYAAIHDSSGNVVGVADASGAGFTERPYEYPMELGPALSYAASEAGKILAGKFQASLQVPWDQLHGQQYWDAANNPENYVNRGR